MVSHGPRTTCSGVQCIFHIMYNRKGRDVDRSAVERRCRRFFSCGKVSQSKQVLTDLKIAVSESAYIESITSQATGSSQVLEE